MNYSGAREKDLLGEIELAKMAIRRETERIAEAERTLANLRAGSNGGEHKQEDKPSPATTALT